jgi:O-antigen ligase
MTTNKYIFRKTTFLEAFNLFLLAFYPVALIIGNLLINMTILLFSVSFFINLKKNKVYFKQEIFYLLIFFFISLLINLFFSTNFENSLPRIIKMFFIIIFVFEIQRLVQNDKYGYMKYIYLFWFMIFVILTIDIIFEIIVGHNILGFISYMPGRIASFFGDELIVGAFYHGFVLFFLSYLIFQKTNNYILILSIMIVLFISFFIGERSNFLKLFLAVTVFSLLAIKINYKIKIFTMSFIIMAISLVINFNNDYKSRYYDQIKSLFSIDGYSEYMKESQYGAHQNAAIKIFKENLYFGVGIKNFRYEVWNKKYENKEYAQTNRRYATHPHQIHHELLSETGIFGYISFLIFILFSLYLGINSFLKTKNLYQLSGIIFIITSLIPIIPSGSFMSTFSSGIFWFNFALMASFIKTRF